MNYLDFLFEIACKMEPVGHARLAACIVKKGVILGFGKNRYKTHPLQAKFAKNEKSIYLHAEIAAIVDALRRYEPEDIQWSTLYLVRAKKTQGIWGSGYALPCSGCTQALGSFGIVDWRYTIEGDY